MKYFYVVVLSLLLTGVIACSSDSAGGNGSAHQVKETLNAKLARLDQETKEIIGVASCSTDSQCHSIGFNHKSCGGFYAFRIYSDVNTDVAKLKKRVAEYNALTRKRNQDDHIVSDCMMLMPPQLSCSQKTCQKKPIIY